MSITVPSPQPKIDFKPKTSQDRGRFVNINGHPNGGSKTTNTTSEDLDCVELLPSEREGQASTLISSDFLRGMMLPIAFHANHTCHLERYGTS